MKTSNVAMLVLVCQPVVAISLARGHLRRGAGEAPVQRTQPSPAPEFLLAKLIRAHGGEANIVKPRKGYLKETSKTRDGDITVEEWFSFPYEWKRTTINRFKGKTTESFLLKTRQSLWEWKEGGEPKQKNNKDAVGDPHFGILIRLAEIGRGEYTLTAVKPIRVAGKMCPGARVVLSKKNAAVFYVDQNTGRLAAWEHKIEAPDHKIYRVRRVFDDYKTFDGVIIAYRQRGSVIRGNGESETLGDVVIAEIRKVSELPKGTFSLPTGAKRNE